MNKPKHLNAYRRILKFILSHLRDFKAHLTVALSFLFITQVVSRLSEAYILMYVINTITSGDPSEELVSQLLLYIGIYALIQLIIRTLITASYLLSIKSYSKLEGTIYKSSYKKINSLSYDFFQNNMSGSILAKIKRLANASEKIVQTFNYNIFKTAVTLTMTITALSIKSLPIGLSLLSFAMLFILATTVVTSKLSDIYSKPAEQNSLLTGRLADNLTNILTIKTFGKSSQEEANLNEISDTYTQLVTKKWSVNELVNSFQVLLMIIIELIIWLILVKGWEAGTVNAGDIAFVQSLLFASFHKLWGIGYSLLAINNSVYDAQEMLDIFDTKSSLNISKNPIQNFKINKGEIHIKDISFNYDNSSQVFQNLNIVIPSGQKIGIVGHSGSGKSTLIKLLLRLMDPLQGEIIFDNQNIQKIDLDIFRSQISYVPQQPLLFHRTILENISYANPKASKEEVIDVAKKAHAHEFISKLPKGYDSLVGERGVKLSGGERQRIAISRAMLEPTKVLILDEATSALDSISEKYIQESFHELMQNRTTIVIAHRLSTIQELDRILVMKDGQIVEDGTHEELLKLQGEYHNLWSHQNNGFIQD